MSQITERTEDIETGNLPVRESWLILYQIVIYDALMSDPEMQPGWFFSRPIPGTGLNNMLDRTRPTGRLE